LNFEAFSPGMMGRLQDVQTGSETDLCDMLGRPRRG
jgi:hypothetical protein